MTEPTASELLNRYSGASAYRWHLNEELEIDPPNGQPTRQEWLDAEHQLRARLAALESELAALRDLWKQAKEAE